MRVHFRIAEVEITLLEFIAEYQIVKFEYDSQKVLFSASAKFAADFQFVVGADADTVPHNRFNGFFNLICVADQKGAAPGAVKLDIKVSCPLITGPLNS
ncbi:MAG: hypothetical protein KAH44_05205 [Oricola sp.]|nr:hypothetical protein [Oricola sp.]